MENRSALRKCSPALRDISNRGEHERLSSSCARARYAYVRAYLRADVVDASDDEETEVRCRHAL